MPGQRSNGPINITIHHVEIIYIGNEIHDGANKIEAGLTEHITNIVGNAILPEAPRWYARPSGILALSVLAAVISAAVVYWLGWN